MTNEEMIKKDHEVMTKVFTKAIKNGWVPRPEVPEAKWMYSNGQFMLKVPMWNGEKMVEEVSICSIERVLFDHDFARYFWGSEESIDSFNDSGLSIYGEEFLGGKLRYPYNEGGEVTFETENWKKNLQQLALEEDRLSYLEKFI